MEGLNNIATKIEENYMRDLQKGCLESRLVSEEKRERYEGEYQRDFTRIMYSTSFRRLQGKMQLLGINNERFFRNRLTHSLEVAQIARSIANELNYKRNELYVVEAGALAHDLGNPPFGHAGERELDKINSDIGGFEGNAQTLRILTSLERKKPGYKGLNLTYRTLLSIVKYFRSRKENGAIYKKFIYDEDYKLLNDFVTENKIPLRTLDVQIVDIADEIAYAAHDLEDGLGQGAFIIDEILHEFKSVYNECESYEKLCEMVENSRKIAGYGNNKISSSEYCKLFRQELSSVIIHTLITDLGLVSVTKDQKNKTGTVHKEELGFLHYEQLASGLKEITFKCINHNSTVYYYEKRGEVLLDYLSGLFAEEPMLLPPEYREEQGDDALQKRLICDYISGMMDSFAISTYEKYSGRSFENILGDVKFDKKIRSLKK